MRMEIGHNGMEVLDAIDHLTRKLDKKSTRGTYR
jgi:hypothetical protein